jgi:hypothetical protein
VRVEGSVRDRFGTVWRPLDGACAGKPQRDAQPRDAQAWRTTVSLPSHLVSSSSLVIEEYERLQEGVPDRLVFFDRIPLQSH